MAVRDTRFPHAQRDSRGHRNSRDQHGRVWEYSYEYASGHACSPYTPKGWEAPVLPAQKYIKPVEGDDSTIYIDYDAWINDLQVRENEWKTERLAIAKHFYGAKALEIVSNEEIPVELEHEIGARPMSVKVPQACKAGNKWILGLATLMPEWAAGLLPEPKQDAVQLFPDVDELGIEQFPDVVEETKKKARAA